MVSLIGSSAVQFSLIWWIASKTSSPIMLSLAGLFAFLPQLFLGPFVGVWIDRIKRKTAIICADLFTGFAATGFAISFFLGDPPIWSACVVLGIRAIGSVFHTPAIQSVTPLLVPEQKLVRANGWSQFMQSGSFMLGPVIGATLFALFPIPIILLTDLVGALIASTAVTLVKIPEIKQEQKRIPNFAKEIKEGITVFLQDKKLCIVTIGAATCMIFYMPLSSFFPLMVADHFNASAWHASVIQFGYAGGMMLCSVLVGAYGKVRDKLLVVHLGLLGIGVSSFFSGVLPDNMMAFWIFLILCTIIGASGNLYNIPYISYMQETIPNEVQGRAFSVMNSVMSVTMPLGLVIAGPTAELLGVEAWFSISGIAFIVIASFSLFLIRVHDRKVYNAPETSVDYRDSE